MARGSSSSVLRVLFAVDTGGLRTGFSRATRETDRFGRSTQRTARQTALLGSTLRRAALAAGGAAAAYISIAQARRAIETTQDLALATKGLERNLGLATTEASRWAAVTRARGVDSRTLVMSFTSLSRAIEGAKKGTESSVEVFQNLGISQKDLAATQGDFSKQVGLVAEAFGNAEGSTTRQAAAQKLLGRGYREILPLFSEGSKGLQEQLKWADEFGATMGKGTVDAIGDFTTAQRRGRVAILGLQIAFAKFATPAITEAIDGLGNLAAVLNDPNLSRTQKIAQLREEFGRLQDRVISIINDLVPIVAQSAGKIGVALAQGVARGFQETGILGKLAISAFFVSAMGGPRAIIGAGAAVGALFAKGQAAAMTNLYAYQNARSAGFGAMASGAALGSSLVGGLAKSIARFLPPAMATLAIGDIILTAIAGDIKGAAIKGGGAAVGGAIGAVIGSVIPGAGTLAGGAIGAGLGVLGAGLINGIIGGAEREAPKLRERIEASVRSLAQAADRERAAYLRLNSTARFVSDSRHRQMEATDRVRAAERQLARARAAFGPSSEQAIRAEIRLAQAKNANARATERVKNAERVYGVERRATRVIIAQSVRQQKAELFTLNQKRGRLSGLIRSERFRNLSAEKQNTISRAYLQVSRAVDRGQRQLNQTYINAGQKIGPAFARSMERISGRTESLRRDIRKLRSGVVLNANQMSQKYRSALERMIKRTELATRVLNSDGNITVINSPIVGNRGGGRISGSGRSVLAAVSPGELISHKGREIYVPGKPEPRDSVLMNLPVGAKVFTYDGQARLAAGASHAQALRDQAPHFATGGIVRPQMVGGLPGQRKVANTGFGTVHKAALAYYRRNALSDLKSVVRFASKFGLTVSSGYRPGDDGYHGVNRARDFVGSPSEMFSFAKWIGTKFGHKLLELIYSPLGWSIKNYERTAPYAVADHYDHVHVAMRKGGKVGNINRIYPESNSAYGNWGGPTLPSYVVAALAQAAGMPGKTMEQVTRGESGAHSKNSARPGATGIDPGGTKGHGLWMITSGYNEDLARKAGGWKRMLNPVVNAWAAAQIYRRQGLGAWYGTGSVTGDGLNYTGNYDIRNALGGLSFQGALWMATKGRLGKKPKSIGKIVKSSKRLINRNDALRGTLSGPGARRAKNLLRRADALARRAAAAAKAGNINKARALMKRANALRGRAAGLGGGSAGGGNGGGASGSGGGGATGGGSTPTGRVGASVNELLRLAARKGITGETRESLLSSALSVAQTTEGTADDLAVLQRQEALQRGRAARARDRLGQANRQLAKKGLSKKERRKWIKQRNEALQALGLAQSEIASIDEQQAELQGGGDTAADLATAMTELADAIKEQNRIQSSVQATSSREALRMLSDVISGQIVGRGTPVGQTPIGVRY